jgi:hypothetical protein
MISHGVPKTLLSLDSPPAALRVEPLPYLRRNPAFASDLAARASVLVAGILFWQWPLMLIGCVLLVWPLRKWRRVCQVMYFGSATPAKVVAVEPPLIAFVGDLARNQAPSSPILVVANADLRHGPNSLDRGDRVAVVALRLGGTDHVAERLEAYVVSSVIARPEAVDRTLADVHEWQWDDLDEAIFAAKNLAAPGVHALAEV